MKVAKMMVSAWSGAFPAAACRVEEKSWLSIPHPYRNRLDYVKVLLRRAASKL
jgi:hypothetical protein